jgi:hypothetical protein
MKTIRFSVEGENSLADINEILSEQEERCSEFLDSKVANQDGKVVNLVTFKLYDDTTVPNKLILRKNGESPPQNATKFWEGVMVASKETVVVVAYRAN